MKLLLKTVIPVLGRIILLLAVATVGGAAVFVTLGAYYHLFILGKPLTALPLLHDEEGIVAALLGMGLGAGILGLGYLHVVLGYALIFRKLPDFWGALPRYFLTMFLGTIAPGLLLIQLIGSEAGLAPLLVFTPPIGFWGTAIYLWWRNWRRPKAHRVSI
jgi:hypothetical protein